jgi:2-aminomuconate deaminase
MGASQESNPFFTFKAPKPVGKYPHAKQVGNLLFLSGLGPRDPQTSEVPGLEKDENGDVVSYDIEKQCHAVFDNVRSVLEDSGSRWENLVDVTVFLTDIQNDFETFNKIYEECFWSVQPCRTTVEVNRLPTPIAIELKCIATVDE